MDWRKMGVSGVTTSLWIESGISHASIEIELESGKWGRDLLSC
jgi:hypothetical protein